MKYPIEQRIQGGRLQSAVVLSPLCSVTTCKCWSRRSINQQVCTKRVNLDNTWRIFTILPVPLVTWHTSLVKNWYLSQTTGVPLSGAFPFRMITVLFTCEDQLIVIKVASRNSSIVKFFTNTSNLQDDVC